MNHCASCKFWRCDFGWLQTNVTWDTPGTCHRRAPTYRDNQHPQFPTIAANDGCGEWESNPEWVKQRWDDLKADGKEDEAIGS